MALRRACVFRADLHQVLQGRDVRSRVHIPNGGQNGASDNDYFRDGWHDIGRNWSGCHSEREHGNCAEYHRCSRPWRSLGAAIVLGDRQANRAVELPACARAHAQNVRMHKHDFDSHRGRPLML